MHVILPSGPLPRVPKLYPWVQNWLHPGVTSFTCVFIELDSGVIQGHNGPLVYCGVALAVTVYFYSVLESAYEGSCIVCWFQFAPPKISSSLGLFVSHDCMLLH